MKERFFKKKLQITKLEISRPAKGITRNFQGFKAFVIASLFETAKDFKTFLVTSKKRIVTAKGPGEWCHMTLSSSSRS